jgi:hypothetical protein
MAERVYLGGVTHTTLHLEEDGTIHVEEKQDCEPILDYTHAMRNHRFDAAACDGMLQHVAEVPMVEYIKWCREASVAPFTPAADIVVEIKLRDPANVKMLAAPKLRDPHIIMRGAR